jgi:hypothetical protein
VASHFSELSETKFQGEFDYSRRAQCEDAGA